MEVRSLRARLGMYGNDFAYLLGVHYTTLCRWEKAAVVRAEPLQAALLLHAQERVMGLPLEAATTLGTELRTALATGGTLKGLAVLLADLVPLSSAADTGT